jgi:hypothetical protein
MSLIINGKFVDVPGLKCLDYRDDAALVLKLPEDSRKRSTNWVRGIVLHTTKGIKEKILPGLGPNTDAGDKVARFWSTDPKSSGAHLVVDFDGTVSCLTDLLTVAAYHATTVNDVTIGIEIYQGPKGELYEGQLKAVVLLVDFLTRYFGIQRQYQSPYRKYKPCPRLSGGGRNCVGIYGHRDQTDNRGPGDPGDTIFSLLDAAAYEKVDFTKSTDIELWKPRQENLKVGSDGIAGPLTQKALAATGKLGGMWVARPIDAAVPKGLYV